jgi:hypothetical protein
MDEQHESRIYIDASHRESCENPNSASVLAAVVTPGPIWRNGAAIEVTAPGRPGVDTERLEVGEARRGGADRRRAARRVPHCAGRAPSAARGAGARSPDQ